MNVCSNCVDSNKLADSYELQIRGRDEDPETITIALCSDCAGELLSIDWIDRKPALSENDWEPVR